VLGELRVRGAAQPFVLITGNGLDSVQEFRRQGVVTLAKPWTRRDLLHAVRRALETGPDPSAGDAPAP